MRVTITTLGGQEHYFENVTLVSADNERGTAVSISGQMLAEVEKYDGQGQVTGSKVINLAQ